MMNTYTILLNGSIKRSDGMYIPPTEENRHYREYLAWVAAGNVADVEQPIVPTEAELKLKARRAAESHILQHFSALELMDMLKRLSAAPNARLAAVNAWIESIQTEAIVNWESPNFQPYGPPPSSYEETFEEVQA